MGSFSTIYRLIKLHYFVIRIEGIIMSKKRKKRQIKTIEKKCSYLSQDFFPSNIAVDASMFYPMLVVGTMSSGKSTLINALLGQQILPSQNEACTSKMYSILDDDTDMNPKLYITNKDGVTIEKKNDLEKELAAANKDEYVKDIFIQGHVNGILNTDRALLIVDTPGPNNSQDLSHKMMMEKTLEKVRGGLILYIINATQLATKDDKRVLDTIKSYMLCHNKTKLLFVVNKVDQIDEEKESIEEIMTITKEYLQSNGFEKPEIIPVSARAASILKKILNKESITRTEFRIFESAYDLYQPHGFCLNSFVISDELPNQFEYIEVEGQKYKISNLMRTLENTGIRLLENTIQKAQILSSGQLQYNIKIK